MLYLKSGFNHYQTVLPLYSEPFCIIIYQISFQICPKTQLYVQFYHHFLQGDNISSANLDSQSW